MPLEITLEEPETNDVLPSTADDQKVETARASLFETIRETLLSHLTAPSVQEALKPLRGSLLTASIEELCKGIPLQKDQADGDAKLLTALLELARQQHALLRAWLDETDGKKFKILGKFLEAADRTGKNLVPLAKIFGSQSSNTLKQAPSLSDDLRKHGSEHAVVEAMGTQDLWEAYKADPENTQLRDTLTQHYLPLVRSIAEQLKVRLPPEVDIGDLISAGSFGLMAAIDAFDLSRGVKFETYCTPRIRGAMLDELRTMDWVPRRVRAKVTNLEKKQSALAEELGRPPLPEEVAERLGLSLREYEVLLRETNVTKLLSLSKTLYDTESSKDIHGIDTLVDRTAYAPESRMERLSTLEKILRGCSVRERLLLVGYYYVGLTMKQIGLLLGVSESRISLMHSYFMASKSKFLPPAIADELRSTAESGDQDRAEVDTLFTKLCIEIDSPYAVRFTEEGPMLIGGGEVGEAEFVREERPNMPFLYEEDPLFRGKDEVVDLDTVALELLSERQRRNEGVKVHQRFERLFRDPSENGHKEGGSTVRPWLQTWKEPQTHRMHSLLLDLQKEKRFFVAQDKEITRELERDGIGEKDKKRIVRDLTKRTYTDACRMLRDRIRELDTLPEHSGRVFQRPNGYFKAKEFERLLTPNLKLILRACFAHAQKPQQDRLLLDIGAWDGRVTASLREFFGSTIAVEPHPDRFRQLAKRESDHFSAVNATIEELMEDPNALQTKPDVILMSHLLYHLRTPIDEDVDLQALLWAREQLAPGGILIIILNDTNPRPGTRAHFRRTVRRGEKNQNPQQYVEFLRQRNSLVQVMHPILRFEARTPEGKDALQDIMQWMLPPEVRWLEPRIDEYRTKYTQNSDGQEAFEHALAIIVAHRDPSASPLQTTHLL